MYLYLFVFMLYMPYYIDTDLWIEIDKLIKKEGKSKTALRLFNKTCHFVIKDRKDYQFVRQYEKHKNKHNLL